ncbi:MAG: flagellar hook-associated protein FlgL [Rhodocyclales bacterium]|nr:flagellar hook-associated protein FlgL [Rhodocyclales bacterium]
MRVSSGMIFDAGISGMNRQTASLLHSQQQLSSGQRILRPSDDPVAAARALEVTQASDVVARFKQNQDAATSALGIEEAQLTGAGDVLARARELAIKGGNTTLSATGRKAIATELRASFDQLLGIANATDGDGQHIFAGFMGATTPFSGAVDNILAGNEILYQGDDGQRKLQVSPGSSVPVADSGSDVFQRIRNGNGYFATDYAAGNTGTGIITSGTVTNPAAWAAASTKNVAVQFTVAAGITTYDLVDTVSGNSLLTGGAAPAPAASQRTFQSGQAIVLSQASPPAFDLGGSVTINGAPANGDSFSIAPSTSQSVFATLANLIGALEAPTGTAAGDARYMNEIGFAVNNLDQASNNILGIRSQVGSRMNELDSLGSAADNLSLQYQQTLSNLQDVDYARTISDLTRTQTALQAAQQSFVKIAQLSLFNYL